MKKIQIIDNKLECHVCKIIKDLNEFYIYNGIPKRPCIECKNNYQSNYYVENKEDIEVYRKGYYQENREEIIKGQLERDFLRKEEIAVYQKEYRQENKEDLRAKKRNYIANKYKLNIEYKLRRLVSNAIYQALKFNNSTKDNSIINYLPYSIADLKSHIELLFEPWMNWNNQGHYTEEWDDNNPSTWKWQIDHIIPQAQLPYFSMEDENFKICWALDNLRPYSAKQNVFDGNRK